MSLIQSNAAGFGSGVVDPATGVHFQNRGASFSLDPATRTSSSPASGPRTRCCPGMLFRDGDRRPWVVGGSMGGDIQPQVHVQLVSALVDGGADLATAVAAPRVTVEPDGWLAPPVAVLARRGAGAGRGGRAAGVGPRPGRLRPTTAPWATSTRSSWSTGDPPRAARWRR